ncbi:hypothetical protein JMUB7478_26990 [Staphylococcus aureus]
MEQVAIDLKINLMFSKVGVPRGRGKIERFFQTVNQTFLEQLDLLLLEIPKSRKVHSDGIHFQGFRYSNTNLEAYVGEYVLIRYNPNDMAEIRVFYRDEFLCTAICPEIADYSIDIKDIQHARSQRRKHLKQNIASPSTTELIKEEKNCGYSPQETTKNVKKLKRYRND